MIGGCSLVHIVKEICSSHLYVNYQTRAKPGAALQTPTSIVNSVMVCENIFTAPPCPNGWRCYFQWWNRLSYNFIRDSKSWGASKLTYWFKSYSDFSEWMDFACWWSCIGKGHNFLLNVKVYNEWIWVWPIYGTTLITKFFRIEILSDNH